MILRNTDWIELAKKIKKENKKVIIYGAGMIGTVIVPTIFQKYHLESFIEYYVDSDVRKNGNVIQIGDAAFKIVLPDTLNTQKLDNTVILITNSNFYPVMSMLDAMPNLEQVEAYIVPIIQICEIRHGQNETVVCTTERPVIPKRIHYCWFSNNPIPDYLQRCIDSWKRYCPDYEIIQWNENNYDIEKNLYMKQAYEHKKWGFIPDIARLDILYHYGGIYMDTDVELIRSLDDLLYQQAFCGIEKWGNINFGICSGAVPKHPVVKSILDYRKNIPFCYDDGTLNLETCGKYETVPLLDLGMELINKSQNVCGMTVYPSDFFSPFDYMSGETVITENTYSIHHFSGSWLAEDVKLHREKTRKQFHEILERMEMQE